MTTNKKTAKKRKDSKLNQRHTMSMKQAAAKKKLAGKGKPAKQKVASKKATKKAVKKNLATNKAKKVSPRTKAKPIKQTAAKKKLIGKRKPAKQQAAKSKKAPGKSGKKMVGTKRARTISTLPPDESQALDATEFPPVRPGGRSGGQSGDLQGLSDFEGADSESVEELLEEGNAFEAGIVMGVEDADDLEPLRTHQVPEDDVPGEYLDKD